MKQSIIIDAGQKLEKEAIDYILEKYNYDASVEAYNNSPMVNMLKERATIQ